MLVREIIAVSSEIRVKHINALCGQNVKHWPPTDDHRTPRLESLSSGSKVYRDLRKPPSLKFVTYRIARSERALTCFAFLLFLVRLLCVWLAEDQITGIRIDSFTNVKVH
jgi:hypothetical protein